MRFEVKNGYEPIQIWIKETVKELEAALQSKIELTLEELAVNVLSYAYSSAGGYLEITCLKNEEEISFLLKDSGKDFNPLTHKVKSVDTIPLEELEPGGLGILLAKESADLIEYKRENEENHLFISFSLSQK